jgi:hypothetical protein
MKLRTDLDERRKQIRREHLHLRVDPVLPPAPACPKCGGPADHVMWSVFETLDGEELLTDIDPCGHHFRTELPLPPTIEVSEGGGIFVRPDEP